MISVLPVHNVASACLRAPVRLAVRVAFAYCRIAQSVQIWRAISAHLDTEAHICIPRVRHTRRTLVDLKYNECGVHADSKLKQEANFIQKKIRTAEIKGSASMVDEQG